MLVGVSMGVFLGPNAWIMLNCEFVVVLVLLRSQGVANSL